MEITELLEACDAVLACKPYKGNYLTQTDLAECLKEVLAAHQDLLKKFTWQEAELQERRSWGETLEKLLLKARRNDNAR